MHVARVKALDASGQGCWPDGLNFIAVDALANSEDLKILARSYC